MAKGPICIRRAGTVEEADIIVAWLEEQGIEASVLDRDNPGVLAFGVTDVEGIAICVADAETAERAKALLDEHDRQHSQSMEGAGAGDTVTVRCSECDEVNSFSSDQRGTVQACAECGAYLDVPEAG
jgi:hypothetical protein